MPGAFAADYYRAPPLPEVYPRILRGGNIGRNVELLYQRLRKVETLPEADIPFSRRLRTTTAILGVTGRPFDADFLSRRHLKVLNATSPRNLWEIGSAHAYRAFLRFARGQRLRGEAELNLAIGYANRVRGKGLIRLARDADFLAGLLRSLDYDYHGDIMADHAAAVRSNIRWRRHGGIRKVRRYQPREHLIPALTAVDLKEWLIDVDRARAALDDSAIFLPKVRGLAGRANASAKEHFALEREVLRVVDQLAESRIFMKDLLFQLRRSSDKGVGEVRDANIEDFRELRADLRLRAEELLGYMLISRMRNAF